MFCPFCSIEHIEVLLENELAVAFYDKYPVQKGHLLVIPKEHVPTYFEATQSQIIAIHQLLNEGKKLIEKEHKPDGYNIGVNISPYGGQTVNHLHFHLIPRYKGDIEDPRGGIRNAIPNLVKYPPE